MAGGDYTDQIYGSWEDFDYNGPLLPCAPRIMWFPPSEASSVQALEAKGTEAIAKVSPSNPVADLSTMLGELVKDGIPSIIGGTLKKWRSAPASQVRKDIGGEYLNYQFGWKPLVNDLMKVSSAIVDADAHWAQYERDAGRPVRRRIEFPVKETIKIDEIYPAGPWLSPSSTLMFRYGPPWNDQCFREHKVTKRQWFSGAFMYYLPTGDGARDSVAMNVIQAKKLLGLSLTPDLLWNIAPWSWAVDWFSNTGDIIQNWSNWAIDGQVLLYGYMMEHTISEYTYTHVGNTYLRVNTLPQSFSLVTETKQRVGATPYGFGLDWDGFTPTQTAVVTALGMNRVK